MSSYFRNVAFISFILVAIAAFFAGMYFRNFAADSVIRAAASESNYKVAHDFNESIWCKYGSTIDKLISMDEETRKEHPVYQKFVKIAKTVLNPVPVMKITIYDPKGKRFFSSNEMEFVFFDSNFEGDADLQKSMNAQKEIDSLIPSMGHYGSAGELIKGSFVRSYIPLLPEKCTNATGKSPAYMEIYTDITTPWNKLLFFQIVITASVIGAFIIVYLSLFITSRKAEKVINKQHEEKLRLEKEKTAAEAQSQEKSMFLANVSHELRTPLNAIIGFSEIIKDEVMGPVGHPQYKEYVNDINSSGVHLLSLINDILDYSKAEARKLEVESIEIDVTKIARSCLRLVEPRAKDAKVKLVENLPERNVVLMADPKRMKQVILNLLSNAVKFTPEEGTVNLIIKEEPLENIVNIIISDTGIGIAPKDISKAMSPFGQIDSSMSRKYEGTGLGLPLTKKLTDIMSGKFDIKSEVGLGTTITLTFPMNVKK